MQTSAKGLAWGRIRCSGGQGAFCKIDLLLAPLASMFLVKLIGEDLGFLPTAWAFAHKGFQILELLKTGTM